MKKNFFKLAVIFLGIPLGIITFYQTAHAMELNILAFTINGNSNAYYTPHNYGRDKFYGKIRYSSTVYGVPVPTDRKAEMSIPYHEYNTDVRYEGGSFENFPSTVKVSDVTGVKSFVFTRTWIAMADSDEYATMTAADQYTTPTTTKASWGTGVVDGIPLAQSNEIKTLKVIP